MENKEEYKFYCDKCKYGTNMKDSYDKHNKSTLHLTGKRKVRKDRKVDKYKCDKCTFETTREINYKSHCLNNHSTPTEKKAKYPYYCEKCDFGVFIENAYKRHLDTKKHKIRT